MITQEDLALATGWGPDTTFAVTALDLAGTDPGHPILGFLDDGKFLSGAARNPSLSVLLISAELVEEARSRLDPRTLLVVVDDPRWHFYTLHNALAATGPLDTARSVIDPTASIHPTAYIDSVGVRIEAGVVVEPNATVLRSSILEPGALIRAGAVIGTSGFEHKRTSRGVLSVAHDGETRIGAGTEVGSLTTVARGFIRRHTTLGAQCRIDANVMVAHGSQLGDRVFVAAGTVLAGSTTIGDDVWIGPGVTVIDRVNVGANAHIALGSVVFTKVAEGAQVIGNPARPRTRRRD